MSTDSKPVWLEILISNTVAALVTVILGGIVGQLILMRFQNKAKDREQSVIDYKQKVERQQDAMQHAYESAAKSIVTSNSLMQLTQPAFDLRAVPKEDIENLRKQKREVVEKYNSTSGEWQIEQEKIRLLFHYYYGQEALPAWQGAKESVDRLRKCAFMLYDAHRKDPAKTTSEAELCPGELSDVTTKLDSLIAELEKLKARPQ